MTRTRGRLDRLEGRVEASHDALMLPDGSRTLYTHPDALRAVAAAIRGGETTLLARFLQAETTEGLPGLCQALVSSRELAGAPVG